MNSSAPGISIRNIRKSFGESVAVKGVSIDVPRGAFLVLLGPSGCGKTTMLRMLAGLEAPTSGEIRFGDKPVVSEGGGSVAPGDRDAGLVFQSYALWPHMTVQANIEWPLKVAKVKPSERKVRVDEVLRMLDITALADRYPGEISGGQQQRVAIGRMIAPSPSVLLFDEPLSNLDAKLRVETRAELVRIHRATGATSVYVTHDQVEAMTMATHVAVMRDGVVEQFGTPAELLRDPASSFVATFIGTPPSNVLRAEIVAGRAYVDGLDLGTPGGEFADGPVDLMYRAESLELSSPGNARVMAIEFAESIPMAGRYLVAGTVNGQRISIIADDHPDALAGDTLHVAFPEQPDASFDAVSGARVRESVMSS